MIIAAATLADATWLLEVDTHVPMTWVRRCIELNEYLIARSDDKVVGFLRHSMFWGTIPFMDLIYVEPLWRRLGVGSSLFQAWEQAIRALGSTILMTSSVADEGEPQAWHERNGFKKSGTLTLGAVQPTPEIFFVKSLKLIDP